MPCTMTSPSPILWQSDNQAITLIDVPRSIQHAQGKDIHLLGDLVSCQPLKLPYPSTEPKSEAAKARLQASEAISTLQSRHQRVLQDALEEAHSHHKEQWCLPRLSSSAPSGRKRKRSRAVESIADSVGEANDAELPLNLLSTLCNSNGSGEITYRLEMNSCMACNDCGSTDNVLQSNCGDSISTMIARTQHSASVEDCHFPFRVPAKASFVLGDVTESRSFHSAIRNQAQEHDTRRRFDFMLLDPPWPNRSVKRAYQTPGKTYGTADTLYDIRQLLLNTDLDMLMEEDCLVGIWITNRLAIRELVLGENGIFASWSLELEEEWLWLKTTVCGEAVTALDGLWRKPYEVLLLGRRRRRSYTSGNANEPGNGQHKLRVMIAVPDLHSRKPCLKQLIEPLIKRRDGEYRALEVFARHLVEGWWSWGNECIKFNWEGCWLRPQTCAPNDITHAEGTCPTLDDP